MSLGICDTHRNQFVIFTFSVLGGRLTMARARLEQQQRREKREQISFPSLTYHYMLKQSSIVTIESQRVL